MGHKLRRLSSGAATGADCRQRKRSQRLHQRCQVDAMVSPEIAGEGEQYAG